MDEKAHLGKAIEELEARRAILGDAVTDAALAPLKSRLSELEAGEAARAGPAPEGAQAPSGEPSPSGTARSTRRAKRRQPARHAGSVAAGGGAQAAERKLVTALFADFAGFTDMVTSRDPEEVRELVGAAFAVLVPVLERYGGTIEKFIGDGIMVLFGAPAAHEDDARRACMATLAMEEALARFNVRRGAALAMHYGMGTGLVVAGSLGVEGHRGYSAVGQAVNRAARLSALARAGEILADEESARLAGSDVEFSELPAAKLKGFGEAVKLFSLRGLRSGARREAPLLPFMGRKAELGAMLDTWRASTGGSALILVSGEPGIGKTRLVREWTRAILSNVDGEDAEGEAGPRSRPAVIELRSSSYDASSAFRLWSSFLERLAGFAPSDNDAEREAKLSACLDGLRLSGDSAPPRGAAGTPNAGIAGSRSAGLRAFGLAALGLGLGPLPEDGSDEEGPVVEAPPGEDLLASTVARVLAAVAAGRPLVLVCDGFQWCDAHSARLLARLVHGEFAQPVCWVVVCRDGGFGALGGLEPPSGRILRVELGPLDAADVDTLALDAASAMAADGKNGSADREVGDLAALARRSEGNPLFLEELLKQDRGASGTAGAAATRPEATAPAPQVAGVSPALFGIIAARMDALEPSTRDAALVAAVLGDRFPLDLLESLTSQGQVEALLCKDILVDGPDEGMLSFRHGLVRDAIYATLLESSRRDLHRRAATAIRELYPEYASRHPEILARHWSCAGEPRKAIPHRLLAGKRLFMRGAREEAAIHFAEGLALARSSGSVLHVAEFLTWLGRCHGSAIEARDALALFDEALGIYRGLSNTSRVLNLLRWKAFALDRAGDGPGSEGLLSEALVLAAEARSRIAQARVLLDFAEILCAHGRYAAALDHARRGLTLAAALKELILYRRLLFVEGECLAGLGRRDEAVEVLGRCLEACRCSNEETLAALAEERLDTLRAD